MKNMLELVGHDFIDASPIKGVKLNYLSEKLNFKLSINSTNNSFQK